MSSYNYCCFIGNLVRDPELTYLASGTPVVNCTLAVNEISKEKNTLFMPFSVFGKSGEVLIKYTKKGSPLLVSGHLTQYTITRDNVKSTHMKLVVNEFRFLGAANAPNKEEIETPKNTETPPKIRWDTVPKVEHPVIDNEAPF